MRKTAVFLLFSLCVGFAIHSYANQGVDPITLIWTALFDHEARIKHLEGATPGGIAVFDANDQYLGAYVGDHEVLNHRNWFVHLNSDGYLHEALHYYRGNWDPELSTVVLETNSYFVSEGNKIFTGQDGNLYRTTRTEPSRLRVFSRSSIFRYDEVSDGVYRDVYRVVPYDPALLGFDLPVAFPLRYETR